MEKYLIFIIIGFILGMGITYAALASWTLHLTWHIIRPKTSSLKVYDTDGKTVLYSIDFGDVEQGKNYTRQIIIKNEGTVTLKLHLNVPNNACGNGNYGKITWNKEGYILEPGKSVTATITLSIPSTAEVGYNCGVDIGIEGLEP